MVTKVTSNVIDPAAVTAAAVGLGSVDNTADTAKPVSTAQQTALNLKANLASPTFTGTVGGVTKAMVGLGSVDNTADAAKNVSYAASAGTSGSCSGNAATATTATNVTNVPVPALYGIGSYVIGRPANATSYPPGNTISGTILCVTSPGSSYNNSTMVWNGGTPSPTLISVGNWLCVSPAYGTGSFGYSGLWVRIS